MKDKINSILCNAYLVISVNKNRLLNCIGTWRFLLIKKKRLKSFRKVKSMKNYPVDIKSPANSWICTLEPVGVPCKQQKTTHILVKKIVTDSKNMETGGSVSSSVESPSTFMDVGDWRILQLLSIILLQNHNHFWIIFDAAQASCFISQSHVSFSHSGFLWNLPKKKASNSDVTHLQCLKI